MHGLTNPADLVTKHLSQHVIKKHLDILDIWTEGGRAESAPTLSAATRSATEDGWSQNAPYIIRSHRMPRRELFTPMKVPGAPAAASINAARITRGRFLDNGEEFQVVDNWNRRDGKAHEDMGRQWTGTTAFLLKTR